MLYGALNRYIAELEAGNLDYTDEGVGILRFSQVFCAIHALAGTKFKCIIQSLYSVLLSC